MLNYIKILGNNFKQPAYACLFFYLLNSTTNLKFTICRYIGKCDGITISVWNHKKIHKKHGGGFLGCVRIAASAVQRLRDTGCKYPCWKFLKKSFIFLCIKNLLLKRELILLN